MSGLKWERMGDHTRVADFGPLRLWAFKQENSDALDVAPFAEIVTYAKDSDAAEAAAEDVARKAYDALREHFDPVPVLRWTLKCNGCLSEGLFVCEENSPLRAWRLAAMHYGHDVSFHDNDRNGRAEVDTIEANQRAAEAALRALGVSFRVEGA